MIIDFNANFNNYTEKILNNYSIFTYTCPKCGGNHSFTRHASYERNVCFVDNYGTICEEKMCILRLKCGSCNSTHAVLPNDVVPYCIYSFSFTINVLTKYYCEDQKIEDICRIFSISFQLIYSFVSRFMKFLSSAFSVLKNVECDTVCTPDKVLLAIIEHNENGNFLWSYFFTTQWVFLMSKFHNVLASPIWIGHFIE